ncbi:MAG: ATP-dependent Clp protease ATP-binding subunit, partial [Bacteroidota bacterium]|nr:ATP-dependent Clp protease ATP-binding subunit [Bacteroidota bacterium]
VIKDSLKKTFAPEFLNRIDDVVIFNPLSKEDLNKIILIEISDLEKRVKQLGYTIKLSEKAVDFLIDKGFDKQYGARPLKRSIQKYIEDKMASKILRKEISSGSYLKFNWDGKSDNLDIIIQKKQTTNS